MGIREGYKRTEVGIIPESWDCVELKDYIKIDSGESPSKFNMLSHGIPYFKVEQLNNSTKYQKKSPYFIKSNKVVLAGSIIFPKRGAAILLNKIRILAQDSYMDTNLMTLTIINSEIFNEFLYYLLDKIELWRIADTTSVPQINNKHINPLLIPLPPLPEQQAITTALSDIDGLISSLAKLIDKKKNIKQGAMQELLSGKKRFEGFSGDWKECELVSLCSIITKQTGFDYTAIIKPNLFDHQVTGAIPMIQTKNFEERTFDLKTDYYIPLSIAKDFEKILLDQKCILFSIVGASVGNIGLYDGRKLAFCGGAIGIAKFFNDIDAEFAYLYMLSEEGQLQIRNVTKGGGQATVTIEDIRLLRIPDISIEEKVAITGILSDMDRELEILEQKLNKYKDIKQGMMQELLIGRIRLG